MNRFDCRCWTSLHAQTGIKRLLFDSIKTNVTLQNARKKWNYLFLYLLRLLPHQSGLIMAGTEIVLEMSTNMHQSPNMNCPHRSFCPHRSPNIDLLIITLTTTILETFTAASEVQVQWGSKTLELKSFDVYFYLSRFLKFKIHSKVFKLEGFVVLETFWELKPVLVKLELKARNAGRYSIISSMLANTSILRVFFAWNLSKLAPLLRVLSEYQKKIWEK